jgi:hypothetical protein
MTSVFLAFSSTNSYLGAFPTVDDVIGHMNDTSSGNKPFEGSALKNLSVGQIVACEDFSPVTIFVASVTFTGRTKAIYVSIDSGICTVSTTKIKDATYTIPVSKCPMCGSKCVAADDDGHCSYECATGC